MVRFGSTGWPITAGYSVYVTQIERADLDAFRLLDDVLNQW